MDIKVPFYHVVNMFLTGLILICAIVVLFPTVALATMKTFQMDSQMIPEVVITVFIFAVSYEAGMIVHRMGSIITEPILRRSKLIKFNDDYVLFNQKKKEYPIMNTLAREYALSRTGITLFSILAVISLFSHIKLSSVLFAAIALLYFFSCKKHAERIVELMN